MITTFSLQFCQWYRDLRIGVIRPYVPDGEVSGLE